jgi:hypothetical protein
MPFLLKNPTVEGRGWMEDDFFDLGGPAWRITQDRSC